MKGKTIRKRLWIIVTCALICLGFGANMDPWSLKGDMLA
jgi:hypothetical protein